MNQPSLAVVVTDQLTFATGAKASRDAVRDGANDTFRGMRFAVKGETLSVEGLRLLGAENWETFREQVRAAMPEDLRNIEIDLSQTRFVDSCGLGALIALRKTTHSRNGTVRLLNPPPRVQMLFSVTRMNKVFEIVQA
jgi:anti-sigma B factor antagonist